jgi:adenosylcobinamide-phosphate synthase
MGSRRSDAVVFWGGGRGGAVVILLGFAADRVLGDPARLHPVAGFGAVAAWVEPWAWRPSRVVGALYAGALVGAVWGAIAVGVRRLAPAARAAFAVAVLWTTLGGRSLERAALRLQAALDAGDLDRARALAPALVGRDPSTLDGAELVRAAVESVAENTSDAVVAPLLWMAAFGPAGAAGYRAINTLDAMVGHRDARHLRFGWAAARLDDAASWLPARVTALLVTALARGRRRAAWRAAFVDGARHPSPNAGRAEGAFAGALGVRLGGLNHYPHGSEARAALGVGAAPGSQDIARAVRMARRVGLLAAAATSGLDAALSRRAAAAIGARS